MTAHAMQLVRLAVEEESLVGIEAEPTESGVHGTLIEHTARLAVLHGGLHRVEGWCLRSPELWIHHRLGQRLELVFLTSFHLDALLEALYQRTSRTVERVLQFEVLLGSSFVLQRATDAHGSLCLRHLRRAHEDTVGSHVGHVEVNLLRGHQPHVTVDATEEGEVGRVRNNLRTVVVHLHCQYIVASSVEVIGDIIAESRVASLMLRKCTPIDKRRGSLASALEVEVDALALPTLRHLQHLAVPANALMVVAHGISIGIPRMREVDVVPVGVLEPHCTGSSDIT